MFPDTASKNNYMGINDIILHFRSVISRDVVGVAEESKCMYSKYYDVMIQELFAL